MFSHALSLCWKNVRRRIPVLSRSLIVLSAGAIITSLLEHANFREQLSFPIPPRLQIVLKTLIPSLFPPLCLAFSLSLSLLPLLPLGLELALAPPPYLRGQLSLLISFVH